MSDSPPNQDEEHLQKCLAIMEFTESELTAFFEIPPLHSEDGQDVPAAYVRERLSTLGLQPDANADYNIEVYEGAQDEYRGSYPMHELVWIYQCTMVFPVREGTTTRICRLETPWAEAIDPFIAWLYSNDEQDLYDALEAGNSVSDTFTLSFCSLVRAAGCVNHKIQGVIRALYAGEQEESEE